MTSDPRARAIREEQAHVDQAYDRLEELRERAESRRMQALGAQVTTHADLVDRDAAAYEAAARVKSLSLGDTEPLVFGRLDRDDGETHHVGRVSVLSADYEPLVVDWRSDAAAPFYRATTADPQGVRRRRIIQCHGRRVVQVEDQLLDLEAAPSTELVGDASLMAALTRDRSDQMHDIVATIQREQDEVIRQPARGVVVVTGGPGTGKTAVALHRVAYLLYRHRERLERRGILVVGPSRAFADYIRGVLPSLGESRAVLRPLGAFVPGVATDRHDPLDVARVKGDRRMQRVLEAVVDQQREPVRAMQLFERLRSGDIDLRGGAGSALPAQDRAVLAEAWRADAVADRIPTVEDVPIIDAMRWLLGEEDGTVRRSPDISPEELTTFSDRLTAADPGDLIASSDYADFGHVVVDEAQDLSVMQWQMVARRGRGATWTVVGDVAQRTTPAAPSTWNEVAEVIGRREVTITSLSVNYRTTAPIMSFAAGLLPRIAPGQDPPRSARGEGRPPEVLTGVSDLIPAAVRHLQAIRHEVTGTVAVIAPERLTDELITALGDLEVQVHDPWTVKGLEFDAVTVVAPEEISRAAGPGGLYVALTRPTDRLTVITQGDRPPDGLRTPTPPASDL